MLRRTQVYSYNDYVHDEDLQMLTRYRLTTGVVPLCVASAPHVAFRLECTWNHLDQMHLEYSYGTVRARRVRASC